MFASKTPRDLNHDPLPYLYASTDYTARFSHNNLGYPYASSAIYDPRPEFDHVQHNEPNPILIAFREQRPVTTATKDAYLHARRVLRRLGALE